MSAGTTAMISELEPSSTEYKTSTDFTSPWHQKTKTGIINAKIGISLTEPMSHI